MGCECHEFFQLIFCTHLNFTFLEVSMRVFFLVCRRQHGVVICNNGVSLASVQRYLSPPGGAGTATTVEVAAELREVNCRCSGCRTVKAEISGCRRFSGLLHAWERGIDLLLRSDGAGGWECWG